MRYPNDTFVYEYSLSNLNFVTPCISTVTKFKYCVYFQEFSKVCHLFLASTWLLLAVQKNYQPIGVTVPSHCARALKVSYSDVGEGGVAVNCEKIQFFMNTLYIRRLFSFMILASLTFII